MLAGAFRHVTSAASALVVAACFSPTLAGATGTGAGSPGPTFVAGPGALSVRPAGSGVAGGPGPAAAVAGTRYGHGPAGYRGLGRSGPGYGYGYGRQYPFGAAFGLPWALDGLYPGYLPDGPGEPGFAQPLRPEWPTTIGIPASPVQPPALYVVGGNARPAVRDRRGASPASSADPRVVAGLRRDPEAGAAGVAPPLFIRVPSGR